MLLAARFWKTRLCSEKKHPRCQLPEIRLTHMNKINQALHDELLAMRERDQEVRKTLVEKYGRNLHWSADDLAWMESIDHANTARMKEIIAQYGWPGYSLVGEDGEHTVWLLVQHIDRDLPFPKQCLELLTAAV